MWQVTTHAVGEEGDPASTYHLGEEGWGPEPSYPSMSASAFGQF
jgi:hypothetical protein